MTLALEADDFCTGRGMGGRVAAGWMLLGSYFHFWAVEVEGRSDIGSSSSSGVGERRGDDKLERFRGADGFGAAGRFLFLDLDGPSESSDTIKSSISNETRRLTACLRQLKREGGSSNLHCCHRHPSGPLRGPGSRPRHHPGRSYGGGVAVSGLSSATQIHLHPPRPTTRHS